MAAKGKKGGDAGEAGDSEEVGRERTHLVRKPEEYSEVMRKEPKTRSPWAAFMVRPDGFTFETQDSGERVLLLLRRHGVTNLGWIVAVIVALMLPIVLVFVPMFLWLPENFQVMTVIGWYLAVVGYGFERFLTWYFNVYIITDERIVDYDFYSLLYKRVSEAKIDKVEDVTFELGGASRSFFHYGNVYIQTAGERRELDFEDVPKPEVVVKLLNELVLEEEQEKLEGRVK